MRGTHRKQFGFTLIELLVVISLIGILAGFLIVNFVGVRQRGRDSQRKSDVKQMQSSLELYRADNAAYPTSLAACGNSLESGGVTYMQKIPCDPLSGSYIYSQTNGVTYSIVACLENLNDPQKDGTNTAPCTGTTNVSLTVRNP